MATQWHTVFAHLLRPMVEDYYEVATNVPVGDLPREADIVLLRRTAAKKPPFRGLWRLLTEWNILEYKGPSVSPRVHDIDLLVELGLGIHRRLNEQRAKARLGSIPASAVSFWYLANRLGLSRRLSDADCFDLSSIHRERRGSGRHTFSTIRSTL